MNIKVLDTETASLNRGVVDIAIAEIDGNFNIVNTYESLINPECPISHEAMGVHHITPSMVANKPTLDEFMQANSYPLADADVVVGHNVQFDIRFTRDHLPDTFVKVCTLKLARITWPNAESHKLQTLRYALGLDAGNAHRAMGDVITTVSLLRKLAQHHDTDFNGLMTLMSAPLSLETLMPFGKYKGERLQDLPISYVRWLAEKADIEPDLREALAARL